MSLEHFQLHSSCIYRFCLVFSQFVVFNFLLLLVRIMRHTPGPPSYCVCPFELAISPIYTIERVLTPAPTPSIIFIPFHRHLIPGLSLPSAAVMLGRFLPFPIFRDNVWCELTSIFYTSFLSKRPVVLTCRVSSFASSSSARFFLSSIMHPKPRAIALLYRCYAFPPHVAPEKFKGSLFSLNLKLSGTLIMLEALDDPQSPHPPLGKAFNGRFSN